MKKRAFALFCGVIFLFSLFASSTVSAIYTDVIFVNGKSMTAGDYLAQGDGYPTKTPLNDRFAHFYVDEEGNNYLVLNNYSMNTGAETAIFANATLTIILIGENSLSNNRGAQIQCNGDLVLEGDGGLTLNGTTGNSVLVRTGDFVLNNGKAIFNGVDSAIWVDNGDIILNGGSLVATAQNQEALLGNLVLEADFNITAATDKNGNNVVDFNIESLASYKYLVFETALVGDVNGDNTLDMFDYMAVKSHYFEISILEGDEFDRGDINGDGMIDIFDYAEIKILCLK